MVIPYVVLLFLYIGLTVLYAVTPLSPTLPTPWPLLPTVPDAEIPVTTCQADADCSPRHVCLGGTCVPKLLRGGTCDPATGQWISYQSHQTAFAICACLNNELFSQRFFGGDCNVNVGCGVHGVYDPKKQSCLCEPGYQAVGLLCQKLPAVEQPCAPDEKDASQMKGFHPEYVGRCVKPPCSFDAFTGRLLSHGRYEPGWGCVCDPSYGLFGVELEGSNKKYLTSEGFDACASIFHQDPLQPIPVRLYTAFYLENLEPVSLILFESGDVPLLKGGPIILRQSLWRYDFAQHFFKTHPTFHAKTRSAVMSGIFGLVRYTYMDYTNTYAPKDCSEIGQKTLKGNLDEAELYTLLYNHPICRVAAADLMAESMFHDRYIVNPLNLTYRDHPLLNRANAFVLHYDTSLGRWSLDGDYGIDLDRFEVQDTNVPVYGKMIP